MIAALQMYDWDEVQGRTDAFWERTAGALREDGIAAPQALSRPDDPSDAWVSPELLVGQTCGLPFVSGLCGQARVVGRPCYGVEGAEGPTYCSALICRTEDTGDLKAFRGAHAAINEIGSQSGCNALAGELLRQKIDPGRGFFGQITLSGAHRISARMVADRIADIAAIDAVSWALFQELEPVRATRLRVLAWTRATPALPFITGTDHAAHRNTIYSALLRASFDASDPGVPVDVIPADDDDYAPIRQMAAKIRGIRLSPEVLLS